jgi:hypothetical protein
MKPAHPVLLTSLANRISLLAIQISYGGQYD